MRSSEVLPLLKADDGNRGSAVPISAKASSVAANSPIRGGAVSGLVRPSTTILVINSGWNFASKLVAASLDRMFPKMGTLHL